MEYTEEQKQLEKDLQELVIAFDKLYATDLFICASKDYAHLTDGGFDLLAVPDSIKEIPDSGNQFEGRTKNGLRIIVCR